MGALSTGANALVDAAAVLEVVSDEGERTFGHLRLFHFDCWAGSVEG
jgi:hypothetical protein